MVGWHHRLNGHEFEQALGAGEDKAYCTPWGHRESNAPEQLSNNKTPGLCEGCSAKGTGPVQSYFYCRSV